MKERPNDTDSIKTGEIIKPNEKKQKRIKKKYEERMKYCKIGINRRKENKMRNIEK